MLAIRLPEEIEERLTKLADKTGRSKTFYVREAIVEHLTDLEDYYLAEERMQGYSAAKAIPLDELARKHGVGD
jgi:RHH-type transcriptional regulator, rel operon repressor / antitoxin RelB